MIAHTPGPWETQERDREERGIAVIAVRQDVAKGATPTRGMVAWIGQGGANFGKPLIQEANARLIAAAPDLLAALHSIVGACYGVDDGTRLEAALVDAKAAIAKAEGAK